MNEGLVRYLTEQRTRGQHIFGNVSSGIARNVAGAGLEGVEGMVLKGLGLGSKGPKGTAGDPLHVVMAAASAVGSAAASAAGKVGKFLGPVASFLHVPGFAEGVSGFAGGWAMVGERGPELLNLPRGSNVVPNKQMGDYMRSGGDLHVHVDARGATDPAQVHAQVMQGITMALPTIHRTTHAYIVDHDQRNPGTRRGR